MKTVLVSIKGKFWNLILSGDKDVEVRKSRPKDIEIPFKVVCYKSGSGIIGQFYCDGIVEEHRYSDLVEGSCLTESQLSEYAKGNALFGWHVKKDSAIAYDNIFPIAAAGLQKPPQSWCYIQRFTANKVSYSYDGKYYRGTFDNTAEALEEAMNDIKNMREKPTKIFVGQCDIFRPSISSYDAIDAVQCQAADECGEYGEDYLDEVTREQREDLEERMNKAFQEWIDKYNLYPWFYTIPSFDIYTFDGEKIIQEGAER